MLETATQAEIQSHYQCAHALRAQAFRAGATWLLGLFRHAPAPRQMVQARDCAVCA